jgi:hypothetical protein
MALRGRLRAKILGIEKKNDPAERNIQASKDILSRLALIEDNDENALFELFSFANAHINTLSASEHKTLNKIAPATQLLPMGTLQTALQVAETNPLAQAMIGGMIKKDEPKKVSAPAKKKKKKKKKIKTKDQISYDFNPLQGIQAIQARFSQLNDDFSRLISLSSDLEKNEFKDNPIMAGLRNRITIIRDRVTNLSSPTKSAIEEMDIDLHSIEEAVLNQIEQVEKKLITLPPSTSPTVSTPTVTPQPTIVNRVSPVLDSKGNTYYPLKKAGLFFRFNKGEINAMMLAVTKDKKTAGDATLQVKNALKDTDNAGVHFANSQKPGVCMVDKTEKTKFPGGLKFWIPRDPRLSCEKRAANAEEKAQNVDEVISPKVGLLHD